MRISFRKRINPSNALTLPATKLPDKVEAHGRSRWKAVCAFITLLISSLLVALIAYDVVLLTTRSSVLVTDVLAKQQPEDHHMNVSISFGYESGGILGHATIDSLHCQVLLSNEQVLNLSLQSSLSFWPGSHDSESSAVDGA